MAQFDVHRNPGRHRGAIPFVVVVQSCLFDAHVRRLVAPLLAARAIESGLYPQPAPRFVVDGQRVIHDPRQLQTVPRETLGPVVASLAADADSSRIIAAIDVVLSPSAGVERCPEGGPDFTLLERASSHAWLSPAARVPDSAQAARRQSGESQAAGWPRPAFEGIVTQIKSR